MAGVKIATGPWSPGPYKGGWVKQSGIPLVGCNLHMLYVSYILGENV